MVKTILLETPLSRIFIDSINGEPHLFLSTNEFSNSTLEKLPEEHVEFLKHAIAIELLKHGLEYDFSQNIKYVSYPWDGDMSAFVLKEVDLPKETIKTHLEEETELWSRSM